jgi:hypothetical protein
MAMDASVSAPIGRWLGRQELALLWQIYLLRVSRGFVSCSMSFAEMAVEE